MVKNNLVKKAQYTRENTVVCQSTRSCVQKRITCVTPAKPSGKSKQCRKFQIGKCTKFGSFVLQTSNRFHALQNQVENTDNGTHTNDSRVHVVNKLQKNRKSKTSVKGQKMHLKKPKMAKIARFIH